MNELITTGMTLASIVPDPGMGEAPPGADGGFLLILRWTFWIALGVCVGGLVGAGAYMAVSFSRGEGGEHVSRIVKILGGVVLIAAATSLISGLVTASG